MYFSLFDIWFWIWFLLFFPILFVSLYVPGRFVVNRLEIKSGVVKFIVANAIGLVLWGFQGYLFGYLQLRFLSYFYCGASIIYLFYKLKEYRREGIGLMRYFSRRNAYAIAIILVGSVSQLVAIFPSGFRWKEGIKFFGNNGQDGIMHISYIQSIVQQFPPHEPGLAGFTIRNYHYWTDMVLADLSRVWGIPVVHLFFQFIPLYISLLVGIAAYCLVISWGGTRKMALWFLFLLYFASDAAYLVLIALGKPIAFNTPAIDSGVLQFLNMPHMVAKFVFLASLITFQKWLKERKIWFGIITILLFSSLFGFKVYFGIFAAIGIVFVGIAYFVRSVLQKQSYKSAVAFSIYIVIFGILSALIFLPHNYGAGGLVYVYLEWPRSLLGSGSIDWREWWLRRQVYEAAHNIRNLVALDVIAVFIAFTSIYGTRLLGFILTPKLVKFLGYEKLLFLLPPLLLFHLLGLFTIQSSGGVNVYNFFSVSSVILILFTSFIISRIKYNFVGVVLLIVFVTFTIPRSISEVWQGVAKVSSSDFRLISNDEIESLNYLSKNSLKNEIVQSNPANPLDRETPYVAFFSQRKSFLAGGGLLKTHNVNISQRSRDLEEIFKSDQIVDFVTKMKQREISFIYLQKTPEQQLKFAVDRAYLKPVFENKTTIVLQLN